MKLIQAASIQFNVKQGDVDANWLYVREALKRVADKGVNLAVLPEMWSTGFAYRNLNDLALLTSDIVDELVALSQKLNMVVIGSVPEPAGDRVFNLSLIHISEPTRPY